MPVEERYVEVAPGHTIRARPARGTASRPDHILLGARGRQPFELPIARWQAGRVA